MWRNISPAFIKTHIVWGLVGLQVLFSLHLLYSWEHLYNLSRNCYPNSCCFFFFYLICEYSGIKNNMDWNESSDTCINSNVSASLHHGTSLSDSLIFRFVVPWLSQPQKVHFSASHWPFLIARQAPVHLSFATFLHPPLLFSYRFYPANSYPIVRAQLQ